MDGCLTTPRPEGRGFPGSRPRVPVSQSAAPEGVSLRSDISSTGISTVPGAYGKTCRRMFFAALMSRSCRVRQDGHVPRAWCFKLSDRRAGTRTTVQVLRAGIPAVNHDQVPPGLRRLVFELAAELTPARSRGWPWPACGCGSCSWRRGLRWRSRHGRGPAGRRGAVEEVSAGRAGPCGARGRPSPSPWPGSRNRAGSGRACRWYRARAPARRASFWGLGIFSPSLVMAKSLRPRSIPITVPVAGKLFRAGGVNGEGNVPASARIPGDGHRRWVKGGRDRCPAMTTRTPAGVLVLASRSTPPRMENAARVYVADCLAVAGLEPRVPGPLGEERLERRVLVPERLLRGEPRTPR